MLDDINHIAGAITFICALISIVVHTATLLESDRFKRRMAQIVNEQREREYEMYVGYLNNYPAEALNKILLPYTQTECALMGIRTFPDSLFVGYLRATTSDETYAIDMSDDPHLATWRRTHRINNGMTAYYTVKCAAIK